MSELEIQIKRTLDLLEKIDKQIKEINKTLKGVLNGKERSL
jgi:hypothetical protein